MVKGFMIKVYAVLVKANLWKLESEDTRELPSVPENYIIPVAEYLAEQEETVAEPVA